MIKNDDVVVTRETIISQGKVINNAYSITVKGNSMADDPLTLDELILVNQILSAYIKNEQRYEQEYRRE
jgi:hypothetical protein